MDAGGSRLVLCSVNFFQIGGEIFALLSCNILKRMYELVDNAMLKFTEERQSRQRLSIPSAQRIKISRNPRFLREFKTPSQYFALSFSPSSMLKTSLSPSPKLLRVYHHIAICYDKLPPCFPNFVLLASSLIRF